MGQAIKQHNFWQVGICPLQLASKLQRPPCTHESVRHSLAACMAPCGQLTGMGACSTHPGCRACAVHSHPPKALLFTCLNMLSWVVGFTFATLAAKYFIKAAVPSFVAYPRWGACTAEHQWAYHLCAWLLLTRALR